MDSSLPLRSPLADFLRMSGRVASFEEIQALVIEFEAVLAKYGVPIKPGSQLEKACLSVMEILARRQEPKRSGGSKDDLRLLREVLGIWSLLKLLVIRKDHPAFPQFVSHLELLNKGAVGQNTRLLVSDEASNKIFELFFALVLLDVGTDLRLDHPFLGKGDNPDILVTIDSLRWGFALKTVYGPPSKTFCDNLKIGAEQVRDSEAEIGCVVVNFRNLINHDQFGGYLDVQEISELIRIEVSRKEAEVRKDIGDENILNAFSGTRALPGFVAFFQTCATKLTFEGPVPTDICSLGIASSLGGWKEHIPIFETLYLTSLVETAQLGGRAPTVKSVW